MITDSKFSILNAFIVTNFRDALLKMRDVYVQNPALGDASSLDKQLEENAQKLDKLNQELQKFEVSRIGSVTYILISFRNPVIDILYNFVH